MVGDEKLEQIKVGKESKGSGEIMQCLKTKDFGFDCNRKASNNFIQFMGEKSPIYVLKKGDRGRWQTRKLHHLPPETGKYHHTDQSSFVETENQLRICSNLINSQPRKSHTQNGRKRCGMLADLCPTAYLGWHGNKPVNSWFPI